MSKAGSDFQSLVRRVPNWARWLLFLPCAIVGAVIVLLFYQVVYYIDRFFIGLGFGLLGDWLDLIFLTPMAFAFASGGFIGLGAEIAPQDGRSLQYFSPSSR